jgi:hypothetical protein
VLPKLLNYLAFQSFDLELTDEGYSKISNRKKKNNINAPFINLT